MMHTLMLLMLSGQIQASPITNDYEAGQARASLAAERVVLYQPAQEWTYSHHPSITRFKGRFYAMWSNGRKDEDAPGQRVLLSSSEDFLHWSEPVPLVDSTRGKHSELVLTAAGFHVYNDTMAAYFGQYEYQQAALAEGGRPQGDRRHQDTRLNAVTTTDGEHWTPAVSLPLPVVPNHPPQATKSGRLVLCGNISYPYTDDPSGLAGWRMSGIYPPAMAGEVFDDSEGFRVVSQRAGWPVGLCEGSFYQTDDGVLHMLLRSGADRLWVTESTDEGTNWSTPRPTGFTDNVAKFHFGRLPDGRFYYVGNPDPEPRGRRNPLVLSLSRDGVRFDAHYILADEEYAVKQPGLYKGGAYAYPHSMVYDGHLYVVYSTGKEAVAVLRVPLENM